MAELSAAYERVDQIFAEFHRRGIAPALAYGVVADGQLVHAGGLGAIDPSAPEAAAPGPDTVFRIASMSKSFTATSILLLRDRGALRLDDPVGAHVPQLAGLELPTSDSPALTIRHLLTMSGGLPHDDPWGDRQESLGPDAFSELLAGGLRFVAPPGVGFEYSNLGFAILGRVIQNIHAAAGWAPSGLPGHTAFHDFVRGQVLAPLAMSDTGYGEATAPADRLAPGWRRARDSWVAVPPVLPGAFSAMGGLHSTVADLAGWVSGFLDAGWTGAGSSSALAHPLSPASRREMQQQQRAEGVSAELAWPGGPDGPSLAGHAAAGAPRLGGSSVGYGYGLFVEQLSRYGDVISHSGGYPGYGSHMRWHPVTGIGVIALANSTYAGPNRAAGPALLALLDAAEAPARRVRNWPDTITAAARIDSLLASVADAGLPDDAVADVFADNIDMDQPRLERTAALRDAMSRIGPVEAIPDPSADATYYADGPAWARWTATGEAGWRRVEIEMSAQREPRVQTLAVTAISAPSDALLSAARAVVAAIESGSPELDARPYAPQARALRALSGGSIELDDQPTDAPSPEDATFEIRGGQLRWRLSLAVDRAGVVTTCTLALIPVTSSDPVGR